LFSKYTCKKYKSGDEYFSAAVKFRPEDGTIRTLYGIFLHRKGQLDKALKQYEAALPLVPDSADLHYNLGLLYIQKNNYTKALEHAKKAYELGHPLPGLRNKLTDLGVWPQKTSN
jgi:Tfp pilus assembly protein PilF